MRATDEELGEIAYRVDQPGAATISPRHHESRGMHETIIALVAARPEVRVTITTNSATKTTAVEFTTLAGEKWQLVAAGIQADVDRMAEIARIALETMSVPTKGRIE